MRALVYCNFLREVRLGGWGSEGPKGPTLGQYASACATIPLGSGRSTLTIRYQNMSDYGFSDLLNIKKGGKTPIKDFGSIRKKRYDNIEIY